MSEKTSNVYVVPRSNPLILEIKIESDYVQDGLKAISATSLTAIRSIINHMLLIRHYKLLILDVDGIEFGGSALMAKYLMCYEKAMGVKCRVASINMSARLYGQFNLAGLNTLIPSYVKEQSPSPEQYEDFFELRSTKLTQGILETVEEVSNSESPSIKDDELSLPYDEENVPIEDESSKTIPSPASSLYTS